MMARGSACAPTPQFVESRGRGPGVHLAARRPDARPDAKGNGRDNAAVNARPLSPARAYRQAKAILRRRTSPNGSTARATSMPPSRV